MKMSRMTIPAVLAAIVFLGFMSPAGADPFNSVVQGLKSQRFYLSQDSGGTLSAGDRQAVISALKVDHSTIRIAVVKGDRVNSSGLTQLDQALGRNGTLIMLGGKGARIIAGSHENLGSSKINELVAQARGESSNLKDLLLNLNATFDKAIKDEQRSSAVGGFILLAVLILIVAGVAVAIVVVSRRRKRRREQELAELKQNVYEDVTRLGEDISGLDLDVRDPNLDPAARQDYHSAMNSYDEAKAAADQARRPEDMHRVTTALEDGRYYMTAVRARLAGRPVPERRAPCFFNPQHGPSEQDVSWAPPGGAPRSVPACAADAQRVLSGQVPDARLVSVGGYRRPYWDAGPMYAPYASGYYSGFGGHGMLSGVLIGTALGSMFGGGFGGGGFGGGWGGGGYDAGYAPGYDAGNDNGGGGFDIGGGDFGGFDGGGDFGGGDFGGGDW